MSASTAPSSESDLEMFIQPAAQNVPTLTRVAGKVVKVLSLTEQSVVYGRTEPKYAGRKYCAPFDVFEQHAVPN